MELRDGLRTEKEVVENVAPGSCEHALHGDLAPGEIHRRGGKEILSDAKAGVGAVFTGGARGVVERDKIGCRRLNIPTGKADARRRGELGGGRCGQRYARRHCRGGRGGNSVFEFVGREPVGALIYVLCRHHRDPPLVEQAFQYAVSVGNGGGSIHVAFHEAGFTGGHDKHRAEDERHRDNGDEHGHQTAA